MSSNNGRNSNSNSNGAAKTLRLSSVAVDQTTRLAAAWGDIQSKIGEVNVVCGTMHELTSDGYLAACVNAIDSALYTVVSKTSEKTGKTRVTVTLHFNSDSPSLLIPACDLKIAYEDNDLLNVGANAFEVLCIVDTLSKRGDGEELVKGITGKTIGETKQAAKSIGFNVLSRRKAETFRNIIGVAKAIQKAVNERKTYLANRESNVPGSQPKAADAADKAPTVSELAAFAQKKLAEEDAQKAAAARAAAAEAKKAAAAAAAAERKAARAAERKAARAAAAADKAAAAAAAVPGATSDTVREAARAAAAAA